MGSHLQLLLKEFLTVLELSFQDASLADYNYIALRLTAYTHAAGVAVSGNQSTKQIRMIPTRMQLRTTTRLTWEHTLLNNSQPAALQNSVGLLILPMYIVPCLIYSLCPPE